MNALDRIKETQRQLDLTNRDMAKELRVSEFWLSKVLNGHRPPSDDLMLRLEDLRRRKSIVSGTNYEPRPVDEVPDEPPSDPAEELKQRIFQHYSRLVKAAGNDVQRLGWIAEQLRQHVSEPSHWGLKERVAHEVLEEQRKRDETEAQQSKRGHGRTG